jgi:hypothetical protein
VRELGVDVQIWLGFGASASGLGRRRCGIAICANLELFHTRFEISAVIRHLADEIVFGGPGEQPEKEQTPGFR